MLFDRIVEWDNLVTAYNAVRSTKRRSQAAVDFHARWPDNLARIRESLISGEWRQGPYHRFCVYNYTKRREVEAPPYADRIVHHAITQVIEPLFERRFIFDSYSCRKGKGSHAAVDRAEAFMRRAAPCYVLQCDISKFFPSVHHDTLMDIVSRTVRDERTLALIRRAAFVSDTGRGIPIGAVTSQLLSNVYLDVLDHYAKDELGVRLYLRYADDFVIFDRDKRRLWTLFDALRDFVESRLLLRLNPKSAVFPLSRGLDFCGYRTWPTHRKPRKRVVRGFRLRLRTAQHYRDYTYAAQLAASFLAYTKRAAARRTTINTILDRR